MDYFWKMGCEAGTTSRLPLRGSRMTECAGGGGGGQCSPSPRCALLRLPGVVPCVCSLDNKLTVKYGLHVAKSSLKKNKMFLIKKV